MKIHLLAARAFALAANLSSTAASSVRKASDAPVTSHGDFVSKREFDDLSTKHETLLDKLSDYDAKLEALLAQHEAMSIELDSIKKLQINIPQDILQVEKVNLQDVKARDLRGDDLANISDSDNLSKVITAILVQLKIIKDTLIDAYQCNDYHWITHSCDDDSLTCSALTISNGSFENCDNGSGSTPCTGNFVNVKEEPPLSGKTSIFDWKGGRVGALGSVRAQLIGTAYWDASDGAFSADLNDGSLAQDLTGLTVGCKYHIQFDMAQNPYAGSTTDRSFTDDIPESRLQVTVDGGQSGYFFSTTPNTVCTKNPCGQSNMKYELKTYNFTATKETMTITFTSVFGQTEAAGPIIDNVTAVVV
ncbi:hypothetical protein ACHAWF_001080 [Thalassiosira exigua]